MGDTKINYDEKFGMNTFKREICNVMGEKFWDTLTDNLDLPDIETASSCQCRNMCAFMRRFEAVADQEIDGIPVSTAATIRTGSTASLEFISTLKEHRRQKAAITLCSRAVEALFDNGVETVTLSGSSEAVPLYERLGFHSCFNNTIMLYE
jgi:Predicted acetyltransferase involved in intracellular survival and related acetyltransferases